MVLNSMREGRRVFSTLLAHGLLGPALTAAVKVFDIRFSICYIISIASGMNRPPKGRFFLCGYPVFASEIVTTIISMTF